MAARRSSFSSTRAAAWAIVLANATSCERSWGSPCTVRRKNTPAARPCTNTGSATADCTLTSIRCCVQRHPQVADGRVLVHRDHAALVLSRGREHERAMGEAERMPDPTHQGPEDLVGAQDG